MSVDTAGRFVWRELITPATDPSRAFYAELFGWTPASVEMGSGAYTLYKLGGEDVAGMMAPSMPEAPPAWLDYITVEDVDASLARVPGLGGTALTGKIDIPGIGAFAVVRDPTGATFALFRSLTPGATPDVETPAAGTFCWSQLMTTNLDRAVPFYARLFGWEPQPMGEMTVFNRDGRAVASAMPAQMGLPSHWLPYVAVGDCDAAATRAAGLGAKVLAPPTTIPDMGRFAVVADPGGAIVALWKDLGAAASM